MKSFLFLYPIRKYLEQELPPLNQALILERFNKIINARYRQRGYQVFWLLFGREHNSEEPDLSLFDSRIEIRKADKFISAGLSFKRHRDLIYPSPRKILTRLNLTNELVIGGFHQADCVKKIARQAHRMGLNVFVDEDTTDQFFLTVNCGWEIPPVVRTREQYAVSLLRNMLGMKGIPYLHWLARTGVKNQRNDRKKQPWLVQI